MGAYAGVEPTWAAQTDVGRTHIATKGIVQSGLVLNLDAGVSSSYSGSGTTWTDLSGNGNDFTLSGSLTFNSLTGFTGFSSVNKIYSTTFKPSNLKQSQGGQGYTTLVWAKCIGNGITDWQKLIGNGDGDNYIDLYADATTQTYHREDGSSLFYNNNVSVAPDTFVMDDGIWRMYGSTNLNGGITTTPTTNFGIGNEGDSQYDYPWNGNISIVLIYNRILAAAEIQQNFNALRGRYGI